MKIYSNHITATDVREAFQKARDAHGCDIYLDDSKSRTWAPRNYANGLEFGAYSLNGRYHRNSGTGGAGHGRAPDWRDWGYVIAYLFNIDPHARIGFYGNAADFVEKTSASRRDSTDFLDVLENAGEYA